MDPLRLLLVLPLFGACASSDSKEDSPGATLRAMTSASPSTNLSPSWGTDADELSVHLNLSWERGAHDVNVEWALGFDTAATAAGFDWVLIDQTVATHFVPEEILRIDGTSSVIVWGADDQGQTVLEKWTFSPPTAIVDGALPGMIAAREALGLFPGGGIVDAFLFYDFESGTSRAGNFEAATLVLKMRSSPDILSLDLREPEPKVHLLANASSGAEYQVSALSQPGFLGSSAINHLHLGQAHVVKSAWDLDADFVIVADQDHDGVPDDVFSMGHAEGIRYSLWSEFDPENPLLLPDLR